uniref:Uncharacterized protein n=2 Tax=viral metagenome TaxID=1070528 RepID=A0A6M3KHP0_9ZZZZ
MGKGMGEEMGEEVLQFIEEQINHYKSLINGNLTKIKDYQDSIDKWQEEINNRKSKIESLEKDRKLLGGD